MTVAACTGCQAAPVAARFADAGARQNFELYLPGIHCVGCIATVERVLADQPDILNARVNLTRKSALIAADPMADPTPWISALSRAGYEAHEASANDRPADAQANLAVYLGVAGFAMMNVMLLSVAVWSGAADSTRDLMHWFSALIALPATAFSAQPFFRNAWAALSRGRLAMDVPISLAILLACGMSLYETVQGGEEVWFDAALSLTFFLLAGRYLDQRMRRAVRSAAADLSALEPRRALRIEGSERVSRPIEEIGVGDSLWLAAGARVPVDAVLTGERVTIDRSALTGEAEPVTVFDGGTLAAGDVILTGPVSIRATAVGDDTTLRRMARLVGVAEMARSRYSSLAERAAAIYTPAIHLIALLTFMGWLWVTGDIRQSLNVAIATLIITCPCALGLAIPAVSAAATGRLFRKGCLVKSDTALERLAGIDTVVFDKTGTLTQQHLVPSTDLPDEARRIARALAGASDHPLARSLRDVLAEVTPAALTDIREHAGQGISARADGTPVSLFASPGGAASVLTIGDVTHHLARVEQPVPGAANLVATLKGQGFEVSLLTGDNEARARRAADELGIDQVWSDIPADRKFDVIEELHAEGRRVLMVGDGLNDAAALAAADASIAPGHALDISRNAADVVVTSGIGAVAEALATSKSAHRRMFENLMIAACYNAIAIPIAILGFASPLMAAIAMSTSSITVTLNALRVR